MLQFGAVLEDDLFVDPMLKPLLEEKLSIPGDADLIKVETTGSLISISRLGEVL